MKTFTAIRKAVVSLILLAASTVATAQVQSLPSTQPADPSAVVKAVQDYAAANAQQVAALAGEVAGLQTQLDAAKTALVGQQSAKALPWMMVNDEENDYWGVCRWADAAKSASGFFFNAGTVQYSTDGYPIGQNIKAVSQIQMIGCPAGVYQFSYAGTGVVSVSVMGGTYLATGPNTGTVTLPAAGTLVNNQWGSNQPTVVVLITVTSSSATDPIRDMHLWLPGYGPGTPKKDQVYRDEYLALFKNVTGARVMCSLKVNASMETDWSTRLNPTNWDQTSRCVAHENEIELVKEAGLKVLWINLPPNATPDYVTHCANLYHNLLPPGVKLIPEWTNESWNWGFPTRHALDAETKVNPNAFNGAPGQVVTGDPNILDARDAAEHAKVVADIFRRVYADRPGDVLPVFAGQSADATWIDNGLSWLTAKYGSQPFALIAIAPYYGWGDNSPTVDAVFASVNAYLHGATNNGLVDQLSRHQKLAQKFGVSLVDYEGGQSFPVDLNADGSVNPNGPRTLANTDPRMGLLTDEYYAVLHQYGVAAHCEFCLIGEPWSRYGYWSILRDFGDDTPRWDSVQREAIRGN